MRTLLRSRVPQSLPVTGDELNKGVRNWHHRSAAICRASSISAAINWRDLMITAAQVRGYLGVSPSAYEDACNVMGQELAAVVIACILQRGQHINSAGGYLRVLTEKARAGEFSVGPMLMAALRANGVTAKMTG